jgi:hypothetical protein
MLLSKIRPGAGLDTIASAGADPLRSPDEAEWRIQLYGWDLRSRTWHGPSELNLAAARPHRLTAALANAPGLSWFGPMICSTPGEPAGRFFVIIHDLRDCVVALIYCEESKAGPVEIVAVIPAERRSQLRPDFAFEFLAFAGFLESLGGGAELEVSEGIAGAFAETSASDSMVFSISTGLWAYDFDGVLSRCVEQITFAVLHWLRKPCGRGAPRESR